MFKLNDSMGERHEIGNSIASNQLVYASMHKYIKEGGSRVIKLSQLKLYYERDECLLAIQFILKNKSDDVFVYTEPKIMGPVDTYTAKKNIDEIILNLSGDEEIYLIKGHFEGSKNSSGVRINRIDRMLIFTTYGQYVEFGKSSLECNFSWEYYFNLRYFDGFIIGWNESHINYLASLIIEKPPSVLDEKNIVLCDTTYESRIFSIDPIYLTPRYGKIDSYTTVEDDLNKNYIFQAAKEGDVFISEVVVFYEKYINAIEVEYTSKKSPDNKIRCFHIGTETKKNKDKKSILQLTSDDCINYIKFSLDNYFLQSLHMKTFRGKCISCSGSGEGEVKVEIVDNSADRTMNILGFIVGHQERVYSLQFYYEKKII